MRTIDVYCNLIEHEQMKKGDDEISIRTFVETEKHVENADY